MSDSSVTLLSLRNLALSYADMSGSSASDQLVSTPEANSYINASLAEFNQLVVRLDVKLYLTSSLVTVPQGANSFPLPSNVAPNNTGNGAGSVNFMVAYGLDRSGDGSGSPQSMYTIRRMSDWGARNAGNNSFWTPAFRPQVRYEVLGNTITLFPALNAPGTYNLWWYPDAPTLVADTDTVDGRCFWSDYIAVDAAIKMKQKEESDVSVLMMWKQNLIQRIEVMGADRDYSSPRMTGRSDSEGEGWNGGDGGSGFFY